MSKVSDQEDHATPQSRVMARQVVNLEKLAEAQLGSRRGDGGGTWTFNDNLVTLVGRDVVVQSDLLMGVVNVWRGRRCIAWLSVRDRRSRCDMRRA